MKNSRIKNGIMRIVQGIIIGAGAILPGISGGVLAVVFGIYRPAMELLTHPRRALQRYWRMLLAVGIGWAIGFLGGGSVILALFHQSETVATCLFIGLILGTLPDLWHEAGTQGRGNGSYISLIVSFLALFGALMAVKFSSFAEMPANFWGFLFCGVLWGFSFIIPGMTSSSILMAVGLLTPLIDGIAQLDFTVLVPWGLGMVGVMALFARIVSRLFDTHYSIACHAVIGIVLASTLIIIPTDFASTAEMVWSVACAILGAVLVFHSPCRQLAQEFRKILFRRRVGDLRDDAEFVAADAVAVADLGEHGVDRAADLGKHRVAHAMAKGVVDGLELVHVEIVDDCVPAQRGETALIAAAVQKMSQRVDFLRELGIQDVNHQNIDR